MRGFQQFYDCSVEHKKIRVFNAAMQRKNEKHVEEIKNERKKERKKERKM